MSSAKINFISKAVKTNLMIAMLAILTTACNNDNHQQKQNNQNFVQPEVPKEVEQKTTATLLTDDQKSIDRLAISLLDLPEIQNAKQQQRNNWLTFPFAQSDDAQKTIDAALDAGIFAAARTVAGHDPSRPKVFWNSAPAYSFKDLNVPDSRFFGDSTDKIYRVIAATPEYSYEIKGQRNAFPSSDDFSFEAIPTASGGGSPSATLLAKDLNIAADGSFTITADATPANGRKNHLTLAEGTKAIYIRDVIIDWNKQLPNTLTVKRIDTQPTPAERSIDALKAHATTEIATLFAMNNGFVKNTLNNQVPNQLKYQIRSQADGLAGNGGAITSFALQDGEALVITLQPYIAKYISIQTLDPWSRSIQYRDHLSSLSDAQVKKNDDGSISYILAAQDPGYYNWLSTGGLKTGIVLLRIENYTKAGEPFDIAEQVISKVAISKITDLAATLPKGAATVTPTERLEQLQQRQNGFDLRIVP